MAKNKKISAAIIIGVIAVGVVGFWLFQNGNSSSNHVQVHTQFVSKPSFSSFVGAWNNKVRAYDLPKSHLLSSTDNQKLLRQLKGYIDHFSLPVPTVLVTELNDLSQTYPNSLWAYYQRFLATYVGKRTLPASAWEGVHNSEDLRHLIEKTTENKNYDASIKLLLAVDDPCVYFDIYKSELWKRGLSRNNTSCGVESVDKGKYSEISQRIR